jgi:MFS family permease
MPFLRTSRSASRTLVAAAAILGVSVVTAPARQALADEVSPDGKGVVGGALLGGEVVMITEALAGAKPAWAYVVGGILGAGAGGVAGHFIEQDDASQNGRVPMYMLAGGLALIIPAVVLTLNATRWQPEEGATEDSVPAAPAEPGVVGGSIVTSPASPPPPAQPTAPPAGTPPPPPAGTPAPTPPPQSLFDVHSGSLRFGLPVPDVRPVFSVAERRQYGMQAQTEFRMPMLHMTF